LCNQEGSRIRVPAIVLDYPRHSGDTDKGIPNRPSAFAYLVFGLGGITVERIARPMEITAWRNPGIQLGIQARQRLEERNLVELGLI
jgi:hypothetical protein